MDSLSFNLYCSKCKTYRLHKVTDSNPLQTIKCVNCETTRSNQIVNERVRVDRGFWDNYVRKERNNGNKNI